MLAMTRIMLSLKMHEGRQAGNRGWAVVLAPQNESTSFWVEPTQVAKVAPDPGLRWDREQWRMAIDADDAELRSWHLEGFRSDEDPQLKQTLLVENTAQRVMDRSLKVVAKAQKPLRAKTNIPAWDYETNPISRSKASYDKANPILVPEPMASKTDSEKPSYDKTNPISCSEPSYDKANPILV